MSEKVAVLMGGTSAEREQSLMSGRSVVDGLREAGIDAHAIDTRDFSIQSLKEQGFKKAFIALHGRGGEDGTLQAVLEHLQIPYTGSGVIASAIGMSKLRTKLLWRGYNLPVARFVWLTRQQKEAGLDDATTKAIEELGLPLFVKPSNEGSSIGISRVDSREAFKYNSDVLIEAYLSGAEYSVSVLGVQVFKNQNFIFK